MKREAFAAAMTLAAALSGASLHAQVAPGTDRPAGAAPRRERPPIVVAPDRRIPIVLPAEARARVLADMRELLSGIQALFTAVSQQDFGSVARTARGLSRVAIDDVSPVAPSPFEDDFRELGARMRQDFGRIADAAERRGDGPQTLGRLGIAMQACVACHQTFQLNEVYRAPARQGTAEQAVVAGETGTATPPDRRIPLLARPNERAYVLRSMRLYLAGLQTVLVALSQDDWAAVSETARALGTINVRDVSLFSAAKYDVTFRDLALDVRRDFDAIAQSASARNTGETLGRLGETMRKCLACHRTYRLEDAARSTGVR